MPVTMTEVCTPATGTIDASVRKRFQDYYLLGTLGEGEFGKVKYAQHVYSGAFFAIKLIRKEKLDDAHSIKLRREIEILRTIQHPHIVQLTDIIEDHNVIGIVMEYCAGGELFDYILSRKSLSEVEARHFFVQLISGVCHLHSKNIVHRDLKLENLLIGKKLDLKIADMGFARYCGSGAENTLGGSEWLLKTSCGSPFYAAPELVISTQSYYAPKTDIWSCGVILFSMIAGYLPFDDDPSNPDGANIPQLYQHIMQSSLKFPGKDLKLSSSVRHLLQRILCLDPAHRAGWREIWDHPWITEAQLDPNIEKLVAHDISRAVLLTETIPHLLNPANRPQLEKIQESHKRRDYEPQGNAPISPVSTYSLDDDAANYSHTQPNPLENKGRGTAAHGLPPSPALSPPRFHSPVQLSSMSPQIGSLETKFDQAYMRSLKDKPVPLLSNIKEEVPRSKRSVWKKVLSTVRKLIPGTLSQIERPNRSIFCRSAQKN